MSALVAAALLALPQAPVLGPAPACPFLPQYRRLQTRVRSATAPAALGALYAYVADPANENPAACKSIELDRQIAERERRLVTLALPGRRPLPAADVFHCVAVDPRTTRCDGPVEDGTGHADTVPAGARIAAGGGAARIGGGLPNARLIGLYRTTRGAVVEGRPAVRLDPRRPVMLRPARGGGVLVALFTAPAPYKVRKVVWYY